VTNQEIEETHNLISEINVTTEKSCSFRINIFSPYLDANDDNLKVSDVIGVTYSELGLNLASIGYKNMPRQEGRFALRDETDRIASLRGNSNGMFRVENYHDNEPGGFLQWGKKYRLKHLASNRYLSMGPPIDDQNSDPNKPSIRSVVFEDEASDSCGFTFELIPSTLGSKDRDILLKYLMKDSYFKIVIQSDNLTYRLQALDQGGTQKQKEKGSAGIEPVFSTLDEDNIFKVNKVSSNSVGSTNFILSTKSSIMDYLTTYLKEKPDQFNMIKEEEQLKYFNNILIETEFTVVCFKVGIFNPRKSLTSATIDYWSTQVRTYPRES